MRRAVTLKSTFSYPGLIIKGQTYLTADSAPSLPQSLVKSIRETYTWGKLGGK